MMEGKVLTALLTKIESLLESYCGPQKEGDFEWDCTRKAIQSVLLSATDGSYEVVTLPWGETNTQAMYVLA